VITSRRRNHAGIFNEATSREGKEERTVSKLVDGQEAEAAKAVQDEEQAQIDATSGSVLRFASGATNAQKSA
jgi:hypothetical protein